METINIHEAKTNLSRLLNQVRQGESFIIAKAGNPIARVSSIERPEPGKIRRLGFLRGQIKVPEDFDAMGKREIMSLFGENSASSS